MVDPHVEPVVATDSKDRLAQGELRARRRLPQHDEARRRLASRRPGGRDDGGAGGHIGLKGQIVVADLELVAGGKLRGPLSMR